MVFSGPEREAMKMVMTGGWFITHRIHGAGIYPNMTGV